MNTTTDVLIIGGGLAGLTSAIHLAGKGYSVTLVEKSSWPRHKVCGEYVSNEVLPYLQWLQADPLILSPKKISRFLFSSLNGKVITTTLPLGGMGISRYALDYFLFNKAKERGAEIVHDTVTAISFNNDFFTVTTSSDRSFTAKIVIGAYGKRSNIDHILARRFFQQPAPWLAVKAHYRGDFPGDQVALHNFKGGYCGVSKTETEAVNICYLADYHSFKKYRNIHEYEENVLYKNAHLEKIFNSCEMLFDKPLTISQVSFHKKEPVEQHVLMAGDSAGLIHPLCGNGMAMAIHSAKICSQLIVKYFEGKISGRSVLEEQYAATWNKTFRQRLATGRLLASLLSNKPLAETMVSGLVRFPSLLPLIIKKTHGKALEPTN